MPCQHLSSADAAAAAIIERIGNDIRIAVPIGIGKPMLLLNALYRRAEADPSLKLTIFTGLTLTRPRFKSLLEARFAGPLLDRLFPTYPEALYVAALRADKLPANITINEFFLQAGVWLGNAPMQRNYISLNYAHVARHLARAGTNVFAQVMAPSRSSAPGSLSLGSNTDVTLDMRDYIDQRRRAGKPVVVAGEINGQMPYMLGDAEVAADDLDLLLVPEGTPYDLFAPPKEPVSLADFAMALHAATLIKDGGTIQIGIGSFADALAHALILRHTRNADFRALLDKLGAPLLPEAELAPFEHGLYGCTELLVDGFLALRRAGVLKRRVPLPNGGHALVHAGFFVGNQAFYRELREMPDAERAEIVMSSITFTNTLDGDAARKRQERRDARFVNTALTATVLGAISSDALEDGRVVSGVGGQHDLIDMAHQLEGARSIIAVRSTRRQDRRTQSNIVWSYGNTTVPRSLRDIIVTEYGIADIRGRSDRDCVAAMLAIADVAAQSFIQIKATVGRKLERGFRVPAHAAGNTAERIEAALGPARRVGLLPVFPLGTEMTEVEQSLIPALGALKNAGSGQLIGMLWAGFTAGAPKPGEMAALERLKLAAPAGLGERLWRALVLGAIRRAA